MTILEPSRHTFRVPATGIFLGGAVLTSLLAAVFWYNEIVTFRHELREGESEMQTLQEINADLRQRIYAALDPERLRDAAAASGLVSEPSPRYLAVPPVSSSTDLARTP